MARENGTLLAAIVISMEKWLSAAGVVETELQFWPRVIAGFKCHKTGCLMVVLSQAVVKKCRENAEPGFCQAPDKVRGFFFFQN